MTLTKKIIEEFKGTKFAKEGGSCFECCDYEGMYVELEAFISHFVHQVATEAIEAIKLEKKDVLRYGDIECYKEGYSSAITDMEQKAKKFLENL